MEPSPDPTVFYATLAGSTAAMIGLTGGLLVARVLALRDELIGMRVDLKAEFDGLDAAVRAERRHATAVGHSAAEMVALARRGGGEDPIGVGSEVVVAALTDRIDAPPAQWLGLAGGLPLAFVKDLEGLVADTDAYVASLPVSSEDLLERLREPEQWAAPPAAWLTVEDAGPAIVSFDYWSLVKERRSAMRDRWYDVRGRSDALAGPYGNFRSRLIPQRFYFLICVLGALLIADIFVPMFFLPFDDAGVRVALLGAFVALSVALVGYFAFEIRTLRTAADLTRQSVP